MESGPRLSFACCDYDHVQDLLAGRIRAEGLTLDHVRLPIAEIFRRFTQDREWDLSEMSMGMYAHLLSRGDDGLVAIPIFTSRMFRLSAFFGRRGDAVQSLADLRGKRVGYPDWMHTAGVYARAYLMHEIGVPLAEIEWVQAGVNEPGLKEPLPPLLPPEVKRSSRPDRSLDEMLRSGEIDAILSSHLPHSFTAGQAVRLVPDFIAAETAHFRRTGIFPIMHVVALRRDVHEQYPFAAASLCRAFEQAKRESLKRMRDMTISRYPNPWSFAWAEQATNLFGEDFWPYGIAANRRTLDAFLAFCDEQGVTHRKVGLDELFPSDIDAAFGIAAVSGAA
jgi:4,5-dihydroxyphthalate decarboxylase